jgi:hypothetical protein
MQNVEQTCTKQFGNSPILQQLLTNFNNYIDPTANLNNFYAQCWNITTAQGYGLDRIGRVVGVSRTINVPFAVTDANFKETGIGTPFGVAPFWDGSAIGANTFKLTDTGLSSDFRGRLRPNMTA